MSLRKEGIDRENETFRTLTEMKLQRRTTRRDIFVVVVVVVGEDEDAGEIFPADADDEMRTYFRKKDRGHIPTTITSGQR